MLKRLIGAGLGWSLGGLIGGIIGWWIAGKLDQSKFQRRGYQESTTTTTHGDFMFSLLILASQVMKADNRITVKEVEYVKTFLLKHFQIDEVREMMMFLKDMEHRDYSLEEVCIQIDRQMIMEEKNQLIHFLFGLSQADGHVHPVEVELISRIAILLRIPSMMFQSIKGMYAKSVDDLSRAYQILGVSEHASDEEIKKAFREISLQNHPDRVSHLGEDIHKAAEEKFKTVNQAYQKIKKHRGF